MSKHEQHGEQAEGRSASARSKDTPQIVDLRAKDSGDLAQPYIYEMLTAIVRETFKTPSFPWPFRGNLRKIEAELATLPALREQVHQLQLENRLLLRRLSKLEHIPEQFVEINSRFSDQAAAIARLQNPDLVDENGFAHHDMSDRFERLISQQVVPLLYLIPQHMHRNDMPIVRARFEASINAELFGSQIPSVASIQTVLESAGIEINDAVQVKLQDVVTTVAEFRQAIASLGRNQRWEFALDSDLFDPATQDAHVGSTLGETSVVQFVVRPAYVVDDDTRLTRAQVFIAPMQEAGPMQ